MARREPLTFGFDAFGSPPAPIVQGAVKIAVLRANQLGDFLMALPALESLQAAYPAASITLLGLEWHRDFLAGRPGPIDDVVVVPPIRGVTLPEDEHPQDERAVEAFFESMRERHFDVAFQMHGGGRFSNPVVSRLGARITVGMRDPDAARLDISLHYDVSQPETLRLLELVSLVGAPPATLQGHVFLREQDVEEAADVVPARGRPLAVIHPGARDVARRWPVEKFAEVGGSLAETGVDVVVTGSETEHDIVDRVTRAMRHRATPLSGRLTLGGLAGLFARAAVVVGNDTGPLHLARAVGTPTVSVYWCMNVMNSAPLSRRLHRTFVSWRLHCPECGADSIARCGHQVSFVTEIPVRPVADAALALLDETAS